MELSTLRRKYGLASSNYRDKFVRDDYSWLPWHTLEFVRKHQSHTLQSFYSSRPRELVHLDCLLRRRKDGDSWRLSMTYDSFGIMCVKRTLTAFFRGITVRRKTQPIKLRLSTSRIRARRGGRVSGSSSCRFSWISAGALHLLMGYRPRNFDLFSGFRHAFGTFNGVERYLSEQPLSDSNVDILSQWRSIESVYPTVTQMAQDLLAVFLTSLPVERQFNVGRDTCTYRHGKL